jgi:hypothetical protein
MIRNRQRGLRWPAVGLLLLALGGCSLAPGPVVESPPPGPLPRVYPTEATTGVPEGTALTDYDGPCTITAARTEIVGAIISCDRLVIEAAEVIIRSSRLPPVDVDGPERSVVIEDSEIDGGTGSAPAIGYGNLTLRRSEVRGGQHSVLCGSNCVIEDSLLHDQFLPDDADWHNNGFLSNGGTGVRLTGNTITCTPPNNATGGGCSGAASFFGDFAPVTAIMIKDNLFQATPGAFCVRLGYDPDKKFGAEAGQVELTGNVFDRGPTGVCGDVGPVTSTPPGSVLTDNTWTDGGPVVPD